MLNIDKKLDLAKLPIAMGASYNSHDEEHGTRCLPNTRSELLDEIKAWTNCKDSKTILWLSGMAGTGKSTIARTVAQSFDSSNQLGASFFFKRGEGDRSNSSRFFTTIATDLVVLEPGMLVGIKKALEDDSRIAQRTLKDQFEKLILHPLLKTKQAYSQTLPRVIIIDALDECEQEQDVRAILQLLARMTEIQQVPLRVLITSRPELHIRHAFKQIPNGVYQDIVLHEVPKSTIEHDIRLFLEYELSTIRKERLLALDWPSSHQIIALVKLAVPLFIYAATVCRFIGTKGRNPMKNLDKVLEYKKPTFSQLDGTYLPVLSQLLDEQKDDKEEWLIEFGDVVGTIIVLESPLSVTSLACLLHLSREEVKCRLDSLYSVLSIPNSDDVPVRLLHSSFREFLVDPQKQGISPFWVDEKSTHKRLASRCLELMSGPSGLRQDMCDLLGPELQYACRYWISHFIQSQQDILDGGMMHLFFQKHLLHWLEAMSLIRESSRCIYLLDSLQALVGVRSS
jgi:hypothetical protein